MVGILLQQKLIGELNIKVSKQSYNRHLSNILHLYRLHDPDTILVSSDYYEFRKTLNARLQFFL